MNADKFSYIVDENNKTREMGDFEALKLDRDYFSNHTVEDFKEHVKKLLLDFHPDKNKPEVVDRATEATKHIIEKVL